MFPSIWRRPFTLTGEPLKSTLPPKVETPTTFKVLVLTLWVFPTPVKLEPSPLNDAAVTIPVATIPVELTVTPIPALTLKLRLLLLWSYIIPPTSLSSPSPKKIVPVFELPDAMVIPLSL